MESLSSGVTRCMRDFPAGLLPDLVVHSCVRLCNLQRAFHQKVYLKQLVVRHEAPYCWRLKVPAQEAGTHRTWYRVLGRSGQPAWSSV